jgi:hypothetical protein
MKLVTAHYSLQLRGESVHLAKLRHVDFLFIFFAIGAVTSVRVEHGLVFYQSRFDRFELGICGMVRIRCGW